MRHNVRQLCRKREEEIVMYYERDVVLNLTLSLC